MRLECSRCGRAVEFTTERPLFCAFCGQAFTGPREPSAAALLAEAPSPADASPSSPSAGTTAVYDPQAITQAPTKSEDGAGGTAPEFVGGYRLIRPLGEGGMGRVYEAEEVSSGRRVALKLIAAEFAASNETLERFRQEGRLASMIAHPRCV